MSKKPTKSYKKKPFTPAQLKAIKLLSDMESEPLTRAQIAEQCSVCRDTIYVWLRREDFKAEVQKRVQEQYKSYGNLVRSAIVRKAMRGDMTAARLFLEHGEKWKPKQEIEHTTHDNLIILPANGFGPKDKGAA